MYGVDQSQDCSPDPFLPLSLAVSFFHAPKVSCTIANAALLRRNYALLVDERGGGSTQIINQGKSFLRYRFDGSALHD